MTDIFDDLSKLKAPEAELLQTSKTATVEIRKPKRDEWFRVSPDHAPVPFFLYTEDKRETSKTYLILPNVAQDKTIRGVARARIIYVVINRDGDVFLSPVGIGDDSWSQSSRLGHQKAMKNWVRIASDMTQKCYAMHNADFTETPEFPATPYGDLLRDAFGQNVIDSLKHPVALELLGKSSAD
jgi:hypothetical protein